MTKNEWRLMYCTGRLEDSTRAKDYAAMKQWAEEMAKAWEKCDEDEDERKRTPKEDYGV